MTLQHVSRNSTACFDRGVLTSLARDERWKPGWAYDGRKSMYAPEMFLSQAETSYNVRCTCVACCLRCTCRLAIAVDTSSQDAANTRSHSIVHRSWQRIRCIGRCIQRPNRHAVHNHCNVPHQVRMPYADNQKSAMFAGPGACFRGEDQVGGGCQRQQPTELHRVRSSCLFLLCCLSRILKPLSHPSSCC